MAIAGALLVGCGDEGATATGGKAESFGPLGERTDLPVDERPD